jgi:hypothetical protein
MSSRCLSKTDRPQPLCIITIDLEATIIAQAIRGEIAEVCGIVKLYPIARRVIA